MEEDLQHDDPVHWLCTNVRHILHHIDDLGTKVTVLSSQSFATDVLKDTFNECSERFTSQICVQLESRIMTRFKSSNPAIENPMDNAKHIFVMLPRLQIGAVRVC